MNKRNIIKAIGWFGVLTPVYAAGVMTVLLAMNYGDGLYYGRILFVCVVNGYIGYRILKSLRVPLKKVKRHG